MSQSHTPVMLAEAMAYLNVRPGLDYIDATAGAGGHLRQIIGLANGSGTILGIDRDCQTLSRLGKELGKTAKLSHANFSQIRQAAAEHGLSTVSGGILADLGVSSMQLDEPERGFSFLRDGPLDMRMDTSSPVTAAQLVNTLPESELADLIYRFGEEKLSRRIARRIVSARPLHSTGELARLVAGCMPALPNRLHPATRTFQALRMAVNEELSSLAEFLHASLQLLAPGARLVVITFHSLEDRLVKQIFKQAAAGCICPGRQPVCTCNHKRELLIITRKPALPDTKEVLANPRARSAKLRAGEKLDQELTCKASFRQET